MELEVSWNLSVTETFARFVEGSKNCLGSQISIMLFNFYTESTIEGTAYYKYFEHYFYCSKGH